MENQGSMKGILKGIEVAGIAMMFLAPFKLAVSGFRFYLDLQDLAFLWAAGIFFGGLAMFTLASRVLRQKPAKR